jgi:hypothetical protein
LKEAKRSRHLKDFSSIDPTLEALMQSATISLQIRTAIGMAGPQNRRFRLNFCGAISILWLYP